MFSIGVVSGLTELNSWFAVLGGMAGKILCYTAAGGSDRLFDVMITQASLSLTASLIISTVV